MKKKEAESNSLNAAPKFTKQQFMKAANFTRIERDVLNALLEDDKTYTIEEARRILKNFLSRKVK